MKIALLSFHNAANYGAALQAYALQRALLDMGFDNEYINYQNQHRKNSYSMRHHIIDSLKNNDFKGAIKYILGAPFMSLRKIKFKKFYKDNLTYTTEVFSTPNEARLLNSKYNKFIVGSDQVWNFKNNGSDDAFFLSFVDDDSKKISYSSSFGISEIPDDYRYIYSKYLSRIHYLSVREQFGVELVKKLTKKEAVLVLDPVFLLSKEQWIQLANTKINSKSYIFSYTNKPNQLESFINSTQYNLKDKYMFKLSRNINPCDFINNKIRVKYTMSPSEFLSVIRDAELIVSASFHCIALSIILNKPFVAILTGDKGKDERILSILSILGLEKRIFSDKMTLNHVEEAINYEMVNEKIEIMKSSSVDFLNKAIYSNVNQL